MKTLTGLAWIVILIAALTIVSGLVQLLWPEFVLAIIGASISPTSRHFFRIVGMFMALFGGLGLETTWSGENSLSALRWVALQKFGASAAVAWGVIQGIFSPLAFGVAGFDLLSGVLMALYCRRVRP